MSSHVILSFYSGVCLPINTYLRLFSSNGLSQTELRITLFSQTCTIFIHGYVIVTILHFLHLLFALELPQIQRGSITINNNIGIKILNINSFEIIESVKVSFDLGFDHRKIVTK